MVYLRKEKNGKGTENTVFLTPRKPDQPKDKEPMLGIYWDGIGDVSLAHPSPFYQMKSTVQIMWQTITAVISPKTDISAKPL